jgi:hypothetical protein
MSFFKNVLHDLVEKRLWPVAIALVAALVAVPIVLGGGSADPQTAVAEVPVGTANGLANHRDVARAEVVSLEEQAAGKVQRTGSLKNPFVQHHQPKVTKTVTEALTTTKHLADGLSGKSASDSTGGTSDTPATTKPDPTPATKPDPGTNAKPEGSIDDTYRVKLTFGEVGAEKTFNNVARLTPLPSSDNPFFVYLGLADDQKSAIFLVDADAVPSGDGTCQPSEDQCEQVELKAGDVEFFDLQSGTAGVVQYQLTLESIKKVTAATAATARAAHARESRAGREYLRQLVAQDPSALDAWDYSRTLGLLVRTDPATTPDVANVPAAVADGASGQAVEQTSTVLTVPGS